MATGRPEAVVIDRFDEVLDEPISMKSSVGATAGTVPTRHTNPRARISSTTPSPERSGFRQTKNDVYRIFQFLERRPTADGDPDLEGVGEPLPVAVGRSGSSPTTWTRGDATVMAIPTRSLAEGGLKEVAVPTAGSLDR